MAEYLMNNICVYDCTHPSEAQRPTGFLHKETTITLRLISNVPVLVYIKHMDIDV